MKQNEQLWDKISRVPITRKPPLPIQLSERLNELRKERPVTLDIASKESGVGSIDMTRNILYHNLRKVNHDVIKLCNYFEVDINEFVEADE